MAASSPAATIISCRLGPPAPPKQAAAASSRRPQAPAGVSVPSSSQSHALRRACVAAAACAVMGIAGGSGAANMTLALARDGAVVASRTDAVPVVGAMRKRNQAPPRWSERRQCPPWRANSLENVVPENLPRPSAHRRRFDSFSASAAAPDLVTPPPSFLTEMRPSMGCFSL